MSRIVAVLGVLLALWMSLGRWLFGIGGSLSWWYVPTIGLVFAVLQLWLARRMRITRDRGRSTGRSTLVSLVLAWVCALGFGVTVPDYSSHGLESMLSLWGGSAFAAEMSFALANPLGILTFVFAGAAIIFSVADAREPRREDDDDEYAEVMAPHPLA